MALTFLAERRKPSGEFLTNAAEPEGSRPAAIKTQSKVSAKCHWPLTALCCDRDTFDQRLIDYAVPLG